MKRTIIILCEEEPLRELLLIAAESSACRLLDHEDIPSIASASEADVILACGSAFRPEWVGILEIASVHRAVEILLLVPEISEDAEDALSEIPGIGISLLRLDDLPGRLATESLEDPPPVDPLQSRLAELRLNFLAEFPSRLEEMSRHAAAAFSGDLEALQALRNRLHRVAGTGGTLGLRHLGMLARRLENTIDQILERETEIDSLTETRDCLRDLTKVFPSS